MPRTLLVCCLAAALIGCGTSTPPRPDPDPRKVEVDRGKDGEKPTDKDGERPPPKVPDDPDKLPANATVLKMSATKLFNEFKKDRKAAERKTEDAVVQVTGKLVDFARHRSKAGPVNLMLEVEGDPTVFIVCDPVEKAPWDLVSIGQTVTLKGLVVLPESDAVAPKLARGHFVDQKKEPTLTLPAEKLAAEYFDDRKGTAEKYLQRKKLIVTGVIDEIKRNDGAATIYLKGNGKVRIEAAFGTVEQQKTQYLKPGDRIKFMGEVLDFDRDAQQVYRLETCDLIE